MATTFYWFSGHLVIPFTINHNSIHHIWSLIFYRHSKLEIFEMSVRYANWSHNLSPSNQCHPSRNWMISLRNLSLKLMTIPFLSTKQKKMLHIISSEGLHQLVEERMRSCLPFSANSWEPSPSLAKQVTMQVMTRNKDMNLKRLIVVFVCCCSPLLLLLASSSSHFLLSSPSSSSSSFFLFLLLLLLPLPPPFSSSSSSFLRSFR